MYYKYAEIHIPHDIYHLKYALQFDRRGILSHLQNASREVTLTRHNTQTNGSISFKLLYIVDTYFICQWWNFKEN